MTRNKTSYIIFCVVLLLLISCSASVCVFADGEKEYILTDMYDGSTVNAGWDTGYSEAKPIEKDKDLHFGWSLGSFVLKGYTEVIKEGSTPVFLVNPGDSVTLSFKLTQNLDRLNNDDSLFIFEDKNGWDAAFQVDKTNFGRGALLVKYTDHNGKSRVVPHLDYLTAVQGKKANATISNIEEGDYEVALDYEIAHKVVIKTYHNYKTSFKFKVRNSGCLLYLNDNKTNNILPNYSVAENGFNLKYTSFYQRIVSKCEVLTNNGKGYSLTPVECKAASDGQKYEEPGIYTVTVKNVYTNESVDMVVAVGKDPLTNAYVTSQYKYSPDQIAELTENGNAQITDDWLIKVVETPAPSPTPVMESAVATTDSNRIESGISQVFNGTSIMIIVGSVALVIVVGVIIAVIKKNKKTEIIEASKEKYDLTEGPFVAEEPETIVQSESAEPADGEGDKP